MDKYQSTTGNLSVVQIARQLQLPVACPVTLENFEQADARGDVKHHYQLQISHEVAEFTSKILKNSSTYAGH